MIFFSPGLNNSWIKTRSSRKRRNYFFDIAIRRREASSNSSLSLSNLLPVALRPNRAFSRAEESTEMIEIRSFDPIYL